MYIIRLPHVLGNLGRLKVGITDGFVRVSCGVEDTGDLLAALKKGLDDL